MNRTVIPVAFLLSVPLLTPAHAGNASNQDSIPPVWRAAASGDAWRPPASVSEMVAAPSPEVAAMLRHTDEEVSYANGTASLSIPLYEWESGDIRTSLTLRYSIRGYRMDERAGWTGLGWHLSGGGCVARTIIGMPDEYTAFDMRSAASVWADASGHEYLRDLETHAREAQLDRYSYSCPAGNGSFVIRDGAVIQTPHTDNTIELCGDTKEGVRDFILTSPDGTRYVFSVREHVDFAYHPLVVAVPARDDSYLNAVSAWHLSSVTAPGGETVTYSYASVGTWSRKEGGSSGTYTIRNLAQEFPRIVTSYDDGTTESGTSAGAVTTFHDQKILQRISSRTATVEFSHSPRSISGGCDIPQMLAAVRVITPSGKCVRDITLDIEQSAGVPSRLTGITIKSEGVLLDRHTFAYNLPSGVWGCDIFGFANGTKTGHRAVIDINSGTVAGAARFNAGYAHARAMRSHSNALGLVTEYTYEPSDPVTVAPFGTSVPTCSIPVGVRLRGITDRDSVTGRERTREFLYSSPECDIDFASVDASAFISVSGEQSYVGLRPVAPQPDISTTLSFLPRPRLPGFSPERATMRYAEVTELISGTGITVPVRTVRKYDISRCRMRLVPAQRPGYGIGSDRNIGDITLPPSGVPEGVRLALGHGCGIPGGFDERSGTAPVLIEKTEYEHRNGEYRPLVCEKYFHSTVDSATVQTGLFHEAAVRDIVNAYGVRKWDWQSTSDFSFSGISLTHMNIRLDSVAATRFFPDGSNRLATTRHLYSTTAPLLRPLRAPGGGMADLPVMPGIEAALNPFGSDTVSMSNGMRLHIGTRLREGGRVLEHYTAYSSNMTSAAFTAVKAAGQRTLPVLEIWIADGRDTIRLNTEYGMFGSCRRPTAVTLTSPSGDIMDRLSVAGYTPCGKPTGVRRRGKPETAYLWGTIPGQEDLLMSMTVKGTGSSASLTTSFTHEELTGCTSVTAPDGSTRSFAYKGGRLVAEANSEGTAIREYDYGLHAGSPGTTGFNHVTERSRVHAGWAFGEKVTRYDGFGMRRLETTKDFGSEGDVTRVWSCDALHRTLREWVPLPLQDTEDVPGSDSPLTDASVSRYSDPRGFCETTYASSGDGRPVAATLPGSDFAEHPSVMSYGCSRTAKGAYRVIRYGISGGSLRSSGTYADGELDCAEVTDGNGTRTLTFTDILGNTVLRRVETAPGSYADSYTLHDPWGNTLAILPPEASERLGSTSSTWQLSSADAINDYAFLFSYDGALRLRSEKKPGCDEVMYAYDSDGRIAFTRDGNLAAQGRCRFVMHDALGREAVCGTCADIPALWSGDMSAATVPMTARLSGSTGTGFLETGYVVTDDGAEAVAVTDPKLLWARYYDGASFLPPDFSPTVTDSDRDNTGRHTGTMETILDTGSTGTRMLTVLEYGPDGVPAASETAYPDGARLISEVCSSAAGLPLSVSERVVRDGTAAGGSTLHYSYDAHGRVTGVQLGYGSDGQLRMPLLSFSFDAVGNVGTVSYGMSGLSRSETRDIRGALSAWSMGTMFSQSLSYGGAEASDSPADWCGRVTAKSTVMGDYSGRYAYGYSPLGFLTGAAFSSSSDPRMDFSASWSHDRHGNITRMVRKGMLVSLGFGCGTSADIAIRRDGNRISAVSVADIGENPLESQPAPLDAPRGFTYDGNGNMTGNPATGVEHIEWSGTGTPLRVSFNTGEEIRYRYSATGGKLSEEFVDADGTTLRRRDIYGSLEFLDGVFDRRQVDGGYIDRERAFHVYVNDYQGNVLAVLDCATGLPEQFSDYYPYGLPHPTEHAPEMNRRRFGGKEYASEFGFNVCDFGARLHDTLLASFLSPDPKAADYPHISPYAYCAADPVNFIDPTGEEVILYATKLPGLDERYNCLSMATHTFIVVTNEKIGKVKFAYGSEWDGLKGAFSGKLTKRDYTQDHAIMNGKDLDKLKARIIVPPPAGMTTDEFDKKVIEVGNSFGNNPNISYYMIPSKLTEGNCNTSTSTILLKSGVSEKIIKEIKNMIPGIRIGFEPLLRPWTAFEQEKAVKQQQTLDIFKDNN